MRVRNLTRALNVCSSSCMTIETTPESTSPASIDTPTTLLIQLFSEALADIRFPGIDTAVLEKAAEQVTSRAREVERLREALTIAREALHAEQQSLREQARQAHAYARIFATGNEELTGQLDAIVFDTSKQRVAKKPRARRAKVKTPQLMLENDTPVRVASSAS